MLPWAAAGGHSQGGTGRKALAGPLRSSSVCMHWFAAAEFSLRSRQFPAKSRHTLAPQGRGLQGGVTRGARVAAPGAQWAAPA